MPLDPPHPHPPQITPHSDYPILVYTHSVILVIQAI